MLWLISLIGLSGALQGCATLAPLIQKPKVEVAGLRIQHFSLSEADLVVILRLGNPNGFSLPLKSVTVALDVNDRAVAEGHSVDAVTIPANGTALAELSLHTHGDALWRGMKDMLGSPGGTVHYRLHGTVLATALQVPLNFDNPGTLDMDTLLGKNSARRDAAH